MISENATPDVWNKQSATHIYTYGFDTLFVRHEKSDVPNIISYVGCISHIIKFKNIYSV